VEILEHDLLRSKPPTSGPEQADPSAPVIPIGCAVFGEVFGCGRLWVGVPDFD
jgi:hypothetical protein